MIPFNVPPQTGQEIEFIRQAIEKKKICGDGTFTHMCSLWMENIFHGGKVLLTTSGTAALEMAARMCDLEPGDEVILPSFTFSSTANAFVLAGARLVFVDIRPDTMNIDENLIEQAITPRTKVICVVHYAGVASEMDRIMEIAQRYHLRVVEDAAQGMMSTYHGKSLGTFGDFGCFSFHETKNYSMGEGGALFIRDAENILCAEIIREKGTNRSAFIRGEIDKYSWVSVGSSYLPSELNAAYLWPQLLAADQINQDRLCTWQRYRQMLCPLEDDSLVTLPSVPDGCSHNAHIFYLKCRNGEVRNAFIDYMKEQGVQCVFHYIPLHSALAGRRFGRFAGEDRYTTAESERLVRLPLYYGLSEENQQYIVETVFRFFGISQAKFP